MSLASSSSSDGSDSSIAVVGVDADGVIVHSSPGIRLVLGWMADDLVGKPLTTLIPQRLQRPHSEGFRRFASTGELGLVGRTLALPALCADGQERDIELVLSLPSRGDRAAVIGVVRTAERPGAHAESPAHQALREALTEDAPFSEALSASLAIVADPAQWTVATLWVVDSWSGRLRAAAIWEAEPGANPNYVEARSSALLESEETNAGEVWSTGVTRWLGDVVAEGCDDAALAGRSASALFYPLLADHEVVGVLELIDDDRSGLTVEIEEGLWFFADRIGRFVASRTARERAEAQRQRVQLALSARGMGVWTHNIATGQIMWDAQMERLHGLEPGTFGGGIDDYYGRIHPDDRDPMMQQIEEAVAVGRRFEFRCRVQRLDDVEVWLEGSGVPLVDADGEMVELTGICYDITADVRAREELEESARYAALAADVGRAFVAKTTLDEKLQRSTEALVQHLRASFARIWVLPPGNDELVLRASAGKYTHLDGAHGRVRVGDFKIGQIAQELVPHLTNDVQNDPRISDPEWAKREDMHAFAGYPLVVGDRAVGVMALFADRPLPEKTLEALGAVADVVAIGVDQARAAAQVLDLYGQSRLHADALEDALVERARVAEVLQQSLLPPSLPEIEGFALAARYRSGIEAVGGDFYDVFPLGTDRWAILIGDICGRGPEAARLTALARHSLRTALMLGHSPSDALDALNSGLLRSDNDGRFCTVICGVVMADADAAVVDLAVGGHPPAMLMRADGSVEALPTTGTLVGVFPNAKFGRATVLLGMGESLVLYTDGVTEVWRGEKMFGIEGLRDLLGGLAQREPETVVEAVLDAVSADDDSAADDDLALLVIQRCL